MSTPERDLLLSLIREIGDLRAVVEALLREFPQGHPSHDRARQVAEGLRQDRRELTSQLSHLITTISTGQDLT